MRWREVRLGEILKVTSGGTPNRKNPEYFNGGMIPWIKTGDLKERLITKPSEYITELGLEKSSAKLFPPKTVLLAMYGATIGACSILGIEASTNQACAALLPSKDCDETFLYYFLKSIKTDLIEKGVGGAQPNISGGIIKDTLIPLPPLEEQKKIAAILDAADALRQKDKALIAKYEELTQSLFLDMFGDPVTNRKNLPKIKLGELGKWQSGGTPSRKKPDYFEGNIPWLSSGELEKMYTKDSKEHVSELALKETSARLVEQGSLLLGMYDTAALKSTISAAPLSCNQAIAFAKLNSSMVNTNYVYFIIQLGKEHYRKLQRGVRQKNLNLSLVKNIEILYPPISLQNQFSECLLKIEKQKQQAQQSFQKSEELFNSLLQRAFKGELTKALELV
jgi:type I restriction enzyme S subunit